MAQLDKRGLIRNDDDQKIGFKLISAGIALLIARWILGAELMWQMIGSAFTWFATMEFYELIGSGIMALVAFLF